MICTSLDQTWGGVSRGSCLEAAFDGPILACVESIQDSIARNLSRNVRRPLGMRIDSPPSEVPEGHDETLGRACVLDLVRLQVDGRELSCASDLGASVRVSRDPREHPPDSAGTTQEQVEELRRIAEQLRPGRTIGELIGPGRFDGLEAPAGMPASVAGPQSRARGATHSTGGGELRGAETYFDNLAARTGELDVVSQVIVPALIESGERWYRGECAIFQEHRITAFLRRKLEILIEKALQANPSPAQSAVVGTRSGRPA